VLARPKFRRYFQAEHRRRFLQELSENAELVLVTHSIQACRDPMDNMILELAVSGRADCVVTGDKDLLVLDPFQGIRIVTPTTFLEMP
jgi:putative PIN family toxin of toxin-antitoxin system